MHILVANLHEDGSGVSEQVARNRKTIAEVGEITVNAVAPRVAECFYLLRLAGDVVGFAVLHVAAGGGPLEVRVELDAVGRVDVNALHAARSPSRSASDAITCSESPRIIRFDQLASCW